MKEKKQTPWWAYLLLIPLQFVLDLIVMVIALMLDNTSSAVFLTVVAALLAVLTAMVVTGAIYKAIAAGKTRRKRNNPGGEDAPISDQDGLAAWQYWIPLLVQTLLYTGIVIAVGSIEINRFYADPNHVGFAIPVISICLALYFLLTDVVTFLICLLRFGKAHMAKTKNNSIR